MKSLPTGELCNAIFDRCIVDYHRTDDVDAPRSNPYSEGIESTLYDKNWIDTVQWHLEDLARIPDASDAVVAGLKRRIDKSNQERTDCVERIDDFFLEVLRDVVPGPDARLNSETPAWLIDRMSILALKVYHMREETERKDATPDHIERCSRKLAVLEEQRVDLALCLDQMNEDMRAGRKIMKVYRQMKMYNDETLNPALYNRAKTTN